MSAAVVVLVDWTHTFFVDAHETIIIIIWFHWYCRQFSIYGNFACGETNFSRFIVKNGVSCRLHFFPSASTSSSSFLVCYCNWMDEQRDCEKPHGRELRNYFFILPKGHNFYSTAPTKMYNIRNRSRNFPFPWLELISKCWAPNTSVWFCFVHQAIEFQWIFCVNIYRQTLLNCGAHNEY